MIKVSIVAPGRSHLINLCKYLDKIDDVSVVFYTVMPASRCRKFGYEGKVFSLFFPIGILYFVFSRLPWLNTYRRDRIMNKIQSITDILISWFIPACDILIGLNGTATRTTAVAKKKGAVTICDQGSSHIKTLSQVHDSYSQIPLPVWSIKNMVDHYNVADYLMTASEYVRSSDINNGIEESRILYNPYGVNLDLFKKTAKPANDCYDVITVGSWWKHKGCDLLARVCLDTLHLRLLHVGSVADCELPYSPLFSHVDFVPESELPNYYAKAKVFVMPSLDEGFGLVLLQAASCGLPIVGSSRTGSKDIAKLLNNNPCCITVEEPLNDETLEKAIKEAIDQSSKLPDGLRDPYGDYLQNISWDAYGERYYQIIKQII